MFEAFVVRIRGLQPELLELFECKVEGESDGLEGYGVDSENRGPPLWGLEFRTECPQALLKSLCY